MENKLYYVTDETSYIIHEYFDDSIDEIDKDKIKELYNNPENYDIFTEDVIKELSKIIRYNNDKKVDYRIILKPKKDGDMKVQKDISEEVLQETDDDEGVEDDDVEDDDVEDLEEFTPEKYIIPYRKAYVNWINEKLYPEIVENKPEDEILKIYQRFVKKYLSIDTPYRGLLVYHGLGTGKSATAISTAEGLSNSIPITTLLPASLETEFIKEIKLWGETYFKVDKNNWVFFDIKQIQSDKILRKSINDTYRLTLDNIKTISTKSRNLTRDKTLKTGFWLNTYDINKYSEQIYTVPTIKVGETYETAISYIIKNNKPTNKECNKLTENEIVFINQQINVSIKKKYNFIHYNPLPSLDIEKKDKYTENEKTTIRLLKKLKSNEKKYINSPFDEEVIVIDEVHNFVREIYNNSGASRKYYDWIINAINLKLIVLSGTPIINQPSEIAILCNMLKGIIKTYTFTINKKVDLNTLDSILKEHFYTKDSPVQQYYYKKKQGKLIISFIENRKNYESLLDQDNGVVYTLKQNQTKFEDFIEFIYTKLLKIFKGSIIPDKKDILKNKKSILNGKQFTFDNDTNTIFNINQKLFEIYKDDGTMIDLTKNDNFKEYFINPDTNKIIPSRRILLKRMLMGLISFYPIDRSAIKNMPETTKPNNTIYSEYNISKKINIVPCITSLKQFVKYEEVWKEAKLKSMKQNMFGKNEESNNFDYHIRTRQACNVVYENDEFRKIKSTKENKLLIEEMKQKEYNLLSDAGILNYNQGLKIISPKFNNILENIQKYINQDDQPIGKILYYSEFRSDAGSEIFEKILKANGYSKYDGTTDLSDQKRYTFITGSEDEVVRKKNKDAFNDKNNILGNKIQIMIISGAGAEGISLTCVRQVHIMEPYWNYVRIDQVFGRAIRLGSHLDLEPKQRTVEQYLYLTTFPNGSTIEKVYKTIRDLGTWNVPIIDDEEDIVNILFTNYKELYGNIQKIIKLKLDTNNKSADELLFETMESKFNVSQEVIKVIQEASVDCIQNTRDNIVLNDNCIRFDDKLIDEDAYFPGIDDKQLQKIDKKQIDSTFIYNIKPDIYVISTTLEKDNIFVYYKIKQEDNIDIRYIRENGLLLGTLNTSTGIYSSYEISETDIENKLGNKFSIYQELYKLSYEIINDIDTSMIFPSLEKIKDLIGYKVKHNSTELFFYIEYNNLPILRLYEYDISEKINYDIHNITPIILDDNILYKNIL